MTKLTKKQRRAKRERRRLKKNKRPPKASRQQPWVAPKMKLFKAPDLLPDDMPREKRLELIRSIGGKAQEQFAEKYPGIATWFAKYDALYLLSFCAFYFFSRPEGTDPELTEKQPFFAHYLEIMQAFALAQERSHVLTPLQRDAVRLREEILEIGRVMPLRLLNIPQEIENDNELNAYRLRTEMMIQTTAVRNWAHIFQIRRIVLALASSIAAPFEAFYEISPVDFFQMLFRLLDERSELLNRHRDKIRAALAHRDYKEMIAAYNSAFPENIPITNDQVEDLWRHARKKKSALRSMLICHADLKLEDIYSFTLDHARSLLPEKVTDEALERLLNALSYRFGDLVDFNKEHILLGNPVWTRPFILTEKRSYFSAIWGTFPHIALDLLEALVWNDEPLRVKYTDAKAAFLEDEVERLCRSAFPNAKVYRGSLWTDVSTAREYENDLTVVLDNFALVIEAKSGGISDPARRGAPKRLFDTLRTLIEEPSEQALRFLRYLSADRKVHTFKTQRGDFNSIDTSNINYYIPLGTTLSNLGLIGSNLKKLIEAKVVDKKLEELAPSISLTDLEIVFELLPLEIEKIHYLARRREFEAHMQYEGDEMDLLAFYLDNGFNIGPDEYSKALALDITLKSKELDPYFIGLEEGKQLPKPALAMTKWWSDLLNAISDRRKEGWVETGFILLNSTKEDQEKFERMFRTLMRRVKTGNVELKHNWVEFGSGPERRRYLIAGYAYTTADRELRNAIMNEIISSDAAQKARGAVVIGVQTDRLDYPYTVFARRASTDLFDILSLE